MTVTFQRAALDDVRAIVPAGLRRHLREKLRRLLWVGQGLRCTDERYSDACFLKYKNWLVFYRAVTDHAIDVIAVEYNYGQQT